MVTAKRAETPFVLKLDIKSHKKGLSPVKGQVGKTPTR